MEYLDKFQNEMNLSGHNVFVGNRYVPKLDGEWDKSKPYEALTIVQYQGNSFTSRQPVPSGIDISNKEYWVSTGNYNAQIEYYRRDVVKVKDDLIELSKHVDDEFIRVETKLDKKIDDGLTEVNEKITDVENSHNNLDDKIKTMFLIVDDYGTVGDGITDDTAAIENAFNDIKENTVVRFTKEKYLISKPLTINTSNVIVDFNNALLLWNGTDDLGDDNGIGMTRGAIEFVGEETNIRNNIQSISKDDYSLSLNITDTTNYDVGDDVTITIDFGEWATDFSDYKPSITTVCKIISKTSDTITVDYQTTLPLTDVFTGRVYKNKPLENISVKNMRFEDLTEAASEDVTFVERNTWVSAIVLNKVNHFVIDNVKIKYHKAKGIRLNMVSKGLINNIYTSEPKAFGGGAGYGMQVANSQKIDVYNFNGYLNRHLIDFSKSYHCNVYNSSDMHARYGTFDCHGFSEHDITFNNCHGSYVIGNGINSFPTVTENIKINGGTVDYFTIQFVKNLFVTNAKINYIKNIDRINDVKFLNCEMYFKGLTMAFKSGNRGVFTDSHAVIENSYIYFNPSTNTSGYQFRNFSECIIRNNILISEGVFGQIGVENTVSFVFSGNRSKNVLARIGVSTMNSFRLQDNKFISSVPTEIASGSQFIDFISTIESLEYLYILMTGNIFAADNPTRWIRVNNTITGDKLVWKTRDNLLTGYITEVVNGGTLLDNINFHRLANSDVNNSTLESSRILNI